MMTERHDGFSDSTICNIALMLESARELVGDIKRISDEVEAGLNESASLDVIIPLLIEKRDRVAILRDLSVEITASLGSADEGKAGVALPGPQREIFLDLLAEFQELIARESRIDEMVVKQGLRLSTKKSGRDK